MPRPKRTSPSCDPRTWQPFALLTIWPTSNPCSAVALACHIKRLPWPGSEHTLALPIFLIPRHPDGLCCLLLDTLDKVSYSPFVPLVHISGFPSQPSPLICLILVSLSYIFFLVLPAGLVGRDALGISGISASGFGHRSRTVVNDLSRFVSLYDVTRAVARRMAQSLVLGYVGLWWLHCICVSDLHIPE